MVGRALLQFVAEEAPQAERVGNRQGDAALGVDAQQQRNGETVLVIRDPRTGEEIDGALEASEQQRRIAEDRASTAEDELIAVKDRASTAEEELTAAREKVRDLEQQLRNLTGRTSRMGRDS